MPIMHRNTLGDETVPLGELMRPPPDPLGGLPLRGQAVGEGGEEAYS